MAIELKIMLISGIMAFVLKSIGEVSVDELKREARNGRRKPPLSILVGVTLGIILWL